MRFAFSAQVKIILLIEETFWHSLNDQVIEKSNKVNLSQTFLKVCQENDVIAAYESAFINCIAMNAFVAN